MEKVISFVSVLSPNFAYTKKVELESDLERELNNGFTVKEFKQELFNFEKPEKDKSYVLFTFVLEKKD